MNTQFYSRIVIALGGNALQAGTSILVEDQIRACKQTSQNIMQLIKNGCQIAIVHGNGPQVGEIMEIVASAHKANNKHQLFGIDICGAFSQGYIGYHLQNALNEALVNYGIDRQVATIVTQVEVDKDDQGFSNPTKPIGSFYSQEEARDMMSALGITMKEDAGRGWRRVIASPKPLDILQKDIIKSLFYANNIVIACGGGGIPVIKDLNIIRGAEAVIDKDFAAAKLAEILDADLLLILTTVEKISINFNKSNQKNLDVISTAEALHYIENKEFAPGSMLPKVQAAIQFTQSKHGRISIITSLAKACEALAGLTGTTIGS